MVPNYFLFYMHQWAGALHLRQKNGQRVFFCAHTIQSLG